MHKNPYHELFPKEAIMHLTPGHGSGIQWDETYESQGRQTVGLHHFNKFDTVQADDGRYGKVISRTALTAEIRWPDGTIDLVPQFDPRFRVTARYISA